MYNIYTIHLHPRIQYDACDENSWDFVNGKYPLSNACGQLGQVRTGCDALHVLKFTSNPLLSHIDLLVLFTYVLTVTSLVLTPKSELPRLPLLRGGEAYGMSRRPEYVHHGCHACQGEKEVFSCRDVGLLVLCY